jgi:hypothetical protein
MEARHVAQGIQHLQRLPIVEQSKEIKRIGRREMGRLVKREASQDCVQPVRKIARQRDFRRTRKKRAVKPEIVLKGRVQLSMCERRPKPQSEQRQHQSKENAIFTPEATELTKARPIHKNAQNQS